MARLKRVVAAEKALVERFGSATLGLLAVIVMCAALVLVFGSVAEEVMEGETHKIDMAVLMVFRTPGDASDLLGPSWFEEMMRDVTALGSYTFIFIVVASVVGYLLLVRKRALALVVFAAIFGGILISNLLKHGFNRARPEIEHAAQVFSPSFPSGHATLSAVTFLTLGGLLSRASIDWRARIYFLTVAVILTLIVGISRVYLGVHYPSDVIAGWCIGTAWALLCWGVVFWLQSRGEVEPPTDS